MAAVFDAGGLRAARRAHDGLLGGRRTARGVHRPGRLRRILLRRRARRGGGLGASRSCSTRRCASEFERFFARPRNFRPGRLQRLPDVRRCSRAHSRRREHWPRFLRNRSEQFEARFSAGARSPTRPRCCSPAWRARSCRSPWRTARAGRSSPSDAACSAACEQRLVGLPLRHRPRRGRARLSGQSERLAVHGIAALTTPDGRATITMPHPERVYPLRAEFLASARCGRGQRLDAHVPQCAPVARLTSCPAFSPRRGCFRAAGCGCPRRGRCARPRRGRSAGPPWPAAASLADVGLVQQVLHHFEQHARLVVVEQRHAGAGSARCRTPRA